MLALLNTPLACAAIVFVLVFLVIVALLDALILTIWDF
jgi:hypothetical protein